MAHDKINQDRESWFTQAIEIFRPRFAEIGHPLPDKIRVAVGFGPTGARKENNVILGVTLIHEVSVDGTNEIWISPEDADTASMLSTLLHELCHVADNCESGHRGAFADAAKALGLEGKMTATVPGIALAAELMTIAASLGEYPGAAVDFSLFETPVPVPVPGGPAPLPRRRRVSSGPAGQGTRMLLVTCQSTGDCTARDAGYRLRMTRTHLENFGAPSCPDCGWQMSTV